MQAPIDDERSTIAQIDDEATLQLSGVVCVYDAKNQTLNTVRGDLCELSAGAQ